MRRTTAILATVIVGLYAICTVTVWGCFNPDFSTAMILCSAEKPDCPIGYVCNSPKCVREDIVESQDLSISDIGTASTDAAVADLAFPPPDMTRSGCAAGGGNPVGQAWACPGKWGNPYGSAQKLCASGFKVCTSAIPYISAFELQACRSLKGFFAADVLGSRRVPGQPVCTLTQPTRLLYGCGESARASDFTTECGWFSQAVDCSDIRGGIFCPGTPGIIDQFQNAMVYDGALCCPLP